MKLPVIELDKCILCEICIDVCPGVFSMNNSGYVEVCEVKKLPLEELLDAVRNCPADCIIFDE